MEENGREKELQKQEMENLTVDQEKPSISKLLVVILIILCSATLATGLLTLLLLNRFANNIQELITKPQDDSSLVSRIIKELDSRLSRSDYETAHLMILNALRFFPDNPKLFNEYDQILSTVILNIEDPQTVFKILNDGETLIIKFISETDPSHSSSFSQILKLIRDKRSEFLENMTNYIWKLEEGGDTDRVNLFIENYAYIFSSSIKLTEKIMDLLLKRLEYLSKSENISLGLAYSTLEMATYLEENLATSTSDSTFVKHRIDRMNELVSNIEKKEINKEIDSLYSELRTGEQMSPYMDEEVLSAKIQNLLAKVQRLANNPIVGDSDREKIYEGMYRVQKAFQEKIEKERSNSLKEYNQ
ncbi:MAG TPA: hypothetical protein DEA58_06280 [Pseudothermotoga sp.]|jgi:hypothetical protein|nr:MAG: hypothetical protein XD53_0829 [Petrotoga mobilis]HBT26278.1 hypothetical protein [Pseudothermotoga sp.]